jgi:hypothetical protein
MLIDLIEDLRETLRRSPEEAEPYERSLAELVAEAACRGLLACIVSDPPRAALPVKPDQEKIRGSIQQAATLQQLQRYASLLEQADLIGLWAAYRWAGMFQDENERFLALHHIAWHLSTWLSESTDEAEDMELCRTERLSQVSAPGRWLEQEVLRMFHHTLARAGDPTRKASDAAADSEGEL